MPSFTSPALSAGGSTASESTTPHTCIDKSHPPIAGCGSSISYTHNSRNESLVFLQLPYLPIKAPRQLLKGCHGFSRGGGVNELYAKAGLITGDQIRANQHWFYSARVPISLDAKPCLYSNADGLRRRDGNGFKAPSFYINEEITAPCARSTLISISSLPALHRPSIVPSLYGPGSANAMAGTAGIRGRLFSRN